MTTYPCPECGNDPQRPLEPVNKVKELHEALATVKEALTFAPVDKKAPLVGQLRGILNDLTALEGAGVVAENDEQEVSGVAAVVIELAERRESNS